MNEAAKSLISLAECEEVVSKLHNTGSDDVVEIVNYHISQFSEGYPGFLGDYYRLTVEYRHVSVLICAPLLIKINEAVLSLLRNFLQGRGDNDDNELKQMSFFVKSLPTGDEKKRAMLSESGLFRKEVNIFRHIIPKLTKYSGERKLKFRNF